MTLVSWCNCVVGRGGADSETTGQDHNANERLQQLITKERERERVAQRVGRVNMRRGR